MTAGHSRDSFGSGVERRAYSAKAGFLAYCVEDVEKLQEVVSGYFNRTLRDTMENWQSEFLQLMWQVAGLAILWYIASPQSKSESERIETKIDAILTHLGSQRAEKLLRELEERYPKK